MTESERISEEELIEAGPVRPLPVRAQGRTIELWGREVPLVVAAAGGAAASVAAVAIARAASSRAPRRPPRRGLFRRREKVVASRSFLVDVHVLGR
ncbi:MAG TPA: hypothetical protein VKA41_04325 [Solirubrobacterales bacterium]|nr:hypothetical protein [Solirubrobacterales bacterium]